MELFAERHAAKINGELSCLTRVVIGGTLLGICYADGMSRYLRFNGIRIFDYARWAEPLRDQIRENAQTQAKEAAMGIEHRMAKAAIKMYDKHGLILRIDTTVNDVSFFKHHRRVEHRNGSWQVKTAPLRKSIYSLPVLTDLMRVSNRCYLEFLSTLDDPSSALKDLEKIARAVRKGERSLRGFNLFAGDDLDMFQALLGGEFNISGFQNKDPAQWLQKGGRQVSWLLKRLRCHGLIKRVGHCYKYYLTALGRRVAATAVRLREMAVIPSLCAAHSQR